MQVPRLLLQTVLFLTFLSLVIAAPVVLDLQSNPPTLTRTVLTFVYGLPLMVLEWVYVPITHTFELTSYVLKRATFAAIVAALLWPIPVSMLRKQDSSKSRSYWKWYALLLIGTSIGAVWLVLDPNQLTSYVTE